MTQGSNLGLLHCWRILYHCVAWIALAPPYSPPFLGHVLALQEAFPCLSACPNPNSEFKSSTGLAPPMEHVYACMLSHFSGAWLFVTLWTVASQAPLSLRFSRQEYWSLLPCPPPRDLLNPGMESRSPELQADSLPSEPSRKPLLRA